MRSDFVTRNDPLTRRRFLELSLSAAAGAVLLPLAGCGSKSPGSRYEGLLKLPADGYPLLEVSGSYRDIGRKIGSSMKERIRGHLDVSAQYSGIVDYLQGSGLERVEGMLRHANGHFPQYVEEIEGMAEGLDVPFMNLFAFNCRSEIGLLRQACGCSTIALKTEKGAILAHNEDGSDLNIGRMFLVRVTPPSGVKFLAFVYPGLLPGNGPGMNVSGVVQTTNYIEPYESTEGIPRYFLSRAVLEARSLDEAVRLATLKPRAFPCHHNLMSMTEGRLLSVECAAHPDNRHDIMEVEDLYVHTNHFLHPPMVEAAEDGKRPCDVPYISSTTRMDVLGKAIAEGGAPSAAEELVELLSLHEGRPYSPCRHPEGDIHGSTLGTAVFSSATGGMTLYHGNPCLGKKKEYVV